MDTILVARLGVSLDASANADGKSFISRSDSRVPACVVPTDEELTIARHTCSPLSQQPKRSPKYERVS